MKKKQTKMDYNLNRPWLSLDPWQKDYIETPAEQDCFLLCTRQGGKTTAMSIKAVELCVKHFKKGECILISSLTERQAQLMLAKAFAYAREVYDKEIGEEKDKPTMHRLFFKNGAGILCYAAGEEGDSTRGYTIKKLLVDEGSRMKETYFTSATPTLSVTKGSMDIASTPCGTKNKYREETFFYKCSKNPNFKKFYISYKDCPRHNEEFLKKEQERMSKLQWAQEYEAKFLDELQAFFPDYLIDKCMIRKREEGYPINEKTYLGVDVARMGNDDSVLISVVKNNDKLIQIDMEITKKTLLTETATRIKDLNTRYDYSKIYIDTTGMGFGVFDILLDDDETKRKVVSIENDYRSLDYEDKTKKKISKEELYKNLLNLMEKGKLELFKEDEIKESLSSIQYEYEEGKLKIWGSNDHITEALTRV
jgi:hypothetical protein